ncbi:hypothetical protein G647_07307 [Cladophialophora carrionii CBS 160.54]|uniref:Uncharacterized protein n=1 Tax=Cladophialophora carrionii CBS 160.54 TaxID=1279043 RepID=V9D223_9EURO|nr:uncharacterized protein G647_07307 [Cladophialophora carrionii CBS 160.54]ETI20964.1 hypothetical protein G647_07307 [Cladophialophora carrionii CBS 160.54]
MDRFTRIREHYLQGQARTDLQKAEHPPATPGLAADLAFDFDFTALNIDLTLGVDSSAPKFSSTSTAQAGDLHNGQIGIAISDYGQTAQRGRSRVPTPSTISIHKPNEPTGYNEEVLAPVPSVPDEMRIRFTTRDEEKSTGPPCSIYSKEWRQRARKIIIPAEQTACGGPAEVTSVDSDTKIGDMAAVGTSQYADRLVGSGESSSLEDQACAVTGRQTPGAASGAFQTSSPDQNIHQGKNKRKRSRTIRKIVSAFKIWRPQKGT